METLTKFIDPPSLRHLKRLTTKDGLVQHADYEVPDPGYGYSIDDNARALIACWWYYEQFKENGVIQLANIYFNYIVRVEKEGGSFHNFLSFAEKILDAEGSEDSIGRAVWALGETIALSPNPEMVNQAKEILERTNLARHMDHPHVRTKAYILLGLIATGRLNQAAEWADRLIEAYRSNNDSEWHWFENGLYYANGVLPYALAKAAQQINNPIYKDAAIESFTWLNKLTHENGIPSPIGQNGWYKKGEVRARYDQQPLEASDMVLAATALYQLTNDQLYKTQAIEWFSWYKGNNINQAIIFNEDTGGVFDGLTCGGVNKNQGAESIVTYLLAYLSLSQLINA